MCEESSIEWIKKAIMPAFSGAASGAAKAAPGVGVSALVVAGIPLESWVTILTAAYVLVMLIGALPKAIDAFRLIYRMWRPRTQLRYVTEKANQDVSQKIKKAKGISE